ncbi:MAG: radical SAM protein [Bacteroidales bacterium]|nr:radical SAM protein [Bacteroidales bacterium]
MNGTKTDTYRVNEIFYSLQGEGWWTGTPAVFVRLAGCNLRCPFCDTDFSHAEAWSLEELVAEALRLSSGCRHLVLTGGEPSLQVDDAFVQAFHWAGFSLHIETNGTHPLPEGIDWVTLSPKEDWQPQGTVVLEKADELKLVYTGQDVQRWLSFPADHYFLQPCSGENTKEVVRYVLDHPRWSLSLQTHKILDIR